MVIQEFNAEAGVEVMTSGQCPIGEPEFRDERLPWRRQGLSSTRWHNNGGVALWPTSDDRWYPGKTGGRLLHEPLVVGAIMQEPQCLTICSGRSFSCLPGCLGRVG
ncbi:hypothetical protein AVEN_110493-1 [Araneus ventricosus]|uniref:Uncharacterized protein n=1 Tax=Araneus ventricosus TaxID=182803 RepID=A0A4Y2VN92_ARAVE|nr:hypothetical protein AVEN_110493-1 [Araneus ventricosus]